MIEVEDIGDLINKGKAALDRCYYCEYCAPFTHKCKNHGNLKTFEWKTIAALYTFICSGYTPKPKSPDPYDW